MWGVERSCGGKDVDVSLQQPQQNTKLGISTKLLRRNIRTVLLT
jgi:hypothetical protein